MTLETIRKKRGLSIYQLAKKSNIPYMTANDICAGKTSLNKCSAETVYKIARALDVTMEDLRQPYLLSRPPFELFKSNVCHQLKRLGDIGFLIDALEKDEISTYFELKWYPESLYLLAMVDYISRINGVPLCNKYDEMRKAKLCQPLYPSDLLIQATLSRDETVIQRAIQSSIPEFLRFNIIENEVRNVI